LVNDDNFISLNLRLWIWWMEFLYWRWFFFSVQWIINIGSEYFLFKFFFYYTTFN
jgi:hypothetical protein